MQLSSLLIANRGEIAIRVARTAAELGLRTVAVHAEDDAASPHCRHADVAHALHGRGPRAYLDAEQLVEAALRHGCDAIHPGYGFLSERASFARACAAAGVTFVGPAPETLDLFGDKARARRLAADHGVVVLPGLEGELGPEDVAGLLDELGPGGALMIKAVAGGGGRGMRRVERADEITASLERCRSEALAAFGHDAVYVEAFLAAARHVEVQVIGDAHGKVRVLGDRECSLQRRHQKLVEIGPAPWLGDDVRRQLHEGAAALATAARLCGVATVEFLQPLEATPWASGPVFIEANPRLQVEHTVTEEVTGLDLVALQLGVAAGIPLDELLPDRIAERGRAVQLRICAERYDDQGRPHPEVGTIDRLQLPTGPGIRVDAVAEVGYSPSPSYDSLIAKLVVHTASDDPHVMWRKASTALGELHIGGVGTNAGALARITAHPEVRSGPVDTTFLERHPELLSAPTPTAAADPLSVLHAARREPAAPAEAALGDDQQGLRSPVPGTVVSVEVAVGEVAEAGTAVVVVESMKMEHVVACETTSRLDEVVVTPGTTVAAGALLAVVTPLDAEGRELVDLDDVDLDDVRPDLAEVVERHAFGADVNRPEAVAKRRATGQRTARENVGQLVDEGTFVEYAPLVVAAQRRRRSMDDLIRRTPGDGLVGGVGQVNGELFGPEAASTVVMTYDYTVLAGTQGLQNHRKKDRLFELAEQLRLPVVLFAEGGGGRPGDTDGIGGSGLDCLAFHLFGRLSGLVPLVGITSGYCFAGNAALLGTCDVVIATKGSNIGMGGPAMIEGGGLGVYHPSEVGPVDMHVRQGVVDLLVDDEQAAVEAAKRYLGYFQGAVADWACEDQRRLRRAIPENRLRVYDVRRVIETMFDAGSVMELRRGFAAGMVTALARIEGRPVGVVANDPTHLGGAIDAPAADKAAHFMQLCDAHDVPIVFLCDTPGFMVGPEAEQEALVRKAGRLFVVSGSLSVPFMTIVLRKGYGLGAQAMAGGSFRAPLFTIAWPTGEFGGMGLEGAVKLGYRKELEAIEDPTARQQAYEEMVARMYQNGKALSAASLFEIDEVIDPADSRRWITAMLTAAGSPAPRAGKKRPCVETW